MVTWYKRKSVTFANRLELEVGTIPDGTWRVELCEWRWFGFANRMPGPGLLPHTFNYINVRDRDLGERVFLSAEDAIDFVGRKFKTYPVVC